MTIACSIPSYGANIPAPDKDLPAPKAGEVGTITVAGGCFWCTEAVFQQLDGVIDVKAGYAGGDPARANYRAVCEGDTGHAEAIQITYNPSKLTYGKLLQVFFTAHDPTTLNRQGPDSGIQYRSAVFAATPAEAEVATAYITQLNAAKAFSSPIVTTVETLKPGGFFVAEQYHQDYYKLNPNQGYVAQEVPPKLEKIAAKFPELLRKETPATQPSK